MKYNAYIAPNASIKQPLESSGMEIPEYAIERLAECLLPLLRKYFENTTANNATSNSIPTES